MEGGRQARKRGRKEEGRMIATINITLSCIGTLLMPLEMECTGSSPALVEANTASHRANGGGREEGREGGREGEREREGGKERERGEREGEGEREREREGGREERGEGGCGREAGREGGKEGEGGEIEMILTKSCIGTVLMPLETGYMGNSLRKRDRERERERGEERRERRREEGR